MWKPLVNAFCPTGDGGGIDPTCSPGDQKTDKVAEERATNKVSKETATKIYRYVHSGGGAPGKKHAKELEPYRIDGPMVLYKGIREDSGLGDNVSWTKDRSIAVKFAAGGRVVERKFEPSETVVDLEKFGRLRGIKDDFLFKEKEVIITREAAKKLGRL